MSLKKRGFKFFKLLVDFYFAFSPLKSCSAWFSFPEAARVWPSGPFSTVSRLSASIFHCRFLVLEVLTQGRFGGLAFHLFAFT